MLYQTSFFLTLVRNLPGSEVDVPSCSWLFAKLLAGNPPLI